MKDIVLCVKEKNKKCLSMREGLAHTISYVLYICFLSGIGLPTVANGFV